MDLPYFSTESSFDLICGVRDCGNSGKACKGCFLRHYCGLDHQKEDWTVHKNHCKYTKNLGTSFKLLREIGNKLNWYHVDIYARLEVRNYPNKGRGVLTNQNIKCGDHIILETPLVMVLDSDDQPYCNLCGRISKQNFVNCECGDRYCSDSCRSSDLPHKHICKKKHPELNNIYKELETLWSSRNFRYEMYSLKLIALYKCMTEDFNINSEEAKNVILERWAQRSWKDVCIETGLKNISTNILYIPPFSESEFDRMAGLAFVNSKKILTMEDENSSQESNISGLFPVIDILNHSCDPNVALASGFRKCGVLISAIRDIKAGEELTWNYTEGSSIESHQKKLKLSGIKCTCKI